MGSSSRPVWTGTTLHTGFVLLSLSSPACSSGETAVPPKDAGLNDVTLDAAQDARDARAEADVTMKPPGPPTLIELDVMGVGDGDTDIALYPAFSPDVHDYYVRCAAGTNALRVTIAASTGATGALIAPVRSPDKTLQTLSLDVTENQAVVATASAGKATTEYWVRCLPHDFPLLAFEPQAGAPAPPPGYYLIGNLELVRQEAGYAMVLDPRGVPVWYFREPTGSTVSDVDSVVDGAMTFIIPPKNAFIDEPYEIHQIKPQGTTLLQPMGYQPDEHELQHLTNDHFLVLSYPFLAPVDLTGQSFPAGHPLGPGSTIQDCVVVEFERSGNVDWTWSATDHFDPAQVTTLIRPGFKVPNDRTMGGALVYDPYHCNSIDVDPANGNLLVSSRGMSSIFYIERSTGKVLWKMGGPNASKDGAAYVSVSDAFNTQHDARLMPGWSSTCHGGRGQISMFDDESSTEQNARGVVYDVDVGTSDSTGCDPKAPPGPAPGTATVLWQFQGVSHSNASGSFRILPDGSRIIGWGYSGSNPAFTEVDAAGKRLLDFRFPEGTVTFRALKVPLTAFDLEAMRNDVGK